jgi:hypothetical protein
MRTNIQNEMRSDACNGNLNDPRDGGAASLARDGRLAFRTLAASQGLFYAVSGLWPVVHMRSFEAVTGPKVDRWLVRTTGGLLSVIGAALCSAARRERVTPELRALGAGSAGVLAAIDVTYVARKRISPVYLLDAAVQLALVAAWATAASRTSRQPTA